MHFEEQKANASWIYGKNGIVRRRRLQGSPWIFHRVPAKPLAGPLLVQDISGKNLLSSFISLLEKRWERICEFFFLLVDLDYKILEIFWLGGDEREEVLWNSGSLVCVEPRGGRGRLGV